jgi:biotin carboxyl carrier protein
MKKLRIQVNKKVYDVTVEVLSDDDAPVGEQPAQAKAPAASAPSAARSASKPAARPASGPDDSGNVITAPIAGTVQKVFVEEGVHIEAKAPAVLLDAMKMDTYIYAPKSGTVARVEVKSGETVRVGQCLFEYEVEA